MSHSDPAAEYGSIFLDSKFNYRENLRSVLLYLIDCTFFEQNNKRCVFEANVYSRQKIIFLSGKRQYVLWILR